ncbi:MAG: DNA topoisomerase I [Candidatus Bathyarchaeota archaeon]|nr:DNA topoisomerase I [Candidatus Bathyarchaeum tardum]WGM90495.1 MAG: DNA topoisomerase I [Candidatus Bathyarchaeum tardum]
METLHHNGVLIPEPYQGKGLTVKIYDKEVKLTTEQEELAVAWAKKVGTPYVEDKIFAKNFHEDFSEKLGIKVKPGDVDFSAIVALVQEEREYKKNLPKEEKKRLAADRKILREENKEKYGFAYVDGEKMELANYVAEPSSIFMGRGNHPMRGKWKQGPVKEDVILNLSPDAPRPEGNWNEIVWEPEAIWIARWQDKLSGKMKYVWFSDSCSFKQQKEIEKFDKAVAFKKNLSKVKKHIESNLASEDVKRRKTATVCFLIDKLKIRVGDEKDPDEADTVGASTLRKEHIKINGDGTVSFNFLGKDSVPHIFTTKLPELVIKNLEEFSANTDAALFEGVGSSQVSEFLDEVMTGLSAKVFRTLYATDAVKNKLDKTPVEPDQPEYIKKYVATMANLEAAKVCNHKRTISSSWKSSLQKKKDRIVVLKNRAKVAQNKIKERIKDAETKHEERMVTQTERLMAAEAKLEQYKLQLEKNKKQNKDVTTLNKRVKRQQELVTRQKQRIKDMKAKQADRIETLKESLEKRKERDARALEKMELKITVQKETKDYNVSTSLKSYIDPRVYYEWGKKVQYDWKQYYAKSLHKKFSWLDCQDMQK